MEQSIPPATQKFLEQEPSYGRFRRALRKSDQQALDDLFNRAEAHLALVEYVPQALPFDVMLLAMMLEEHKEVMKLRERIETLSTTGL